MLSSVNFSLSSIFYEEIPNNRSKVFDCLRLSIPTELRLDLKPSFVFSNIWGMFWWIFFRKLAVFPKILRIQKLQFFIPYHALRAYNNMNWSYFWVNFKTQVFIRQTIVQCVKMQKFAFIFNSVGFNPLLKSKPSKGYINIIYYVFFNIFPQCLSEYLLFCKSGSIYILFCSWENITNSKMEYYSYWYIKFIVKYIDI